MQIQCMVGFRVRTTRDHEQSDKHQNDTNLMANNIIRLIRKTIRKSCTYFRFRFIKKKKGLRDNSLRENVYEKVKEPNSGRFLSGYVV